MFGIIVAGKRVYDKFAEDEMTVYAAQVSFFIILSVVPFIMLLLTAVQMIPSISNARFMELIVGLVPVDYKSLAFRVVNDLSLKSPATMISVTAVTALWSAGRGMFSVARGLNRVNGHGEKRWYVINRLICSGYTIVFILVCILSLGLLVFGNMIQAFMVSRFPIIADVTTHIINFRALWALMILIIFFLGIYTFVPDKSLKLRDQLPGAVFSTVGWMAFSFAFSLYFSHIGGKNYSYMYGSLTAIVLLLLWLYFCMCILFFGAEINYFWIRGGLFLFFWWNSEAVLSGKGKPACRVIQKLLHNSRQGSVLPANQRNPAGEVTGIQRLHENVRPDAPGDRGRHHGNAAACLRPCKAGPGIVVDAQIIRAVRCKQAV